MTASLKKGRSRRSRRAGCGGYQRGITLTARAAGKSILVTDAYGSVVLSIPSEYQGMEVSVKTCNATYSRGIYDEMGTLGGIFSSRYYIAGKPILDEKGMLQGFVFAGANADSLTEYLANLFSTFILSAGLMLMVSSVLSIVLTNRMTTPLRRISTPRKSSAAEIFPPACPWRATMNWPSWPRPLTPWPAAWKKSTSPAAASWAISLTSCARP